MKILITGGTGLLGKALIEANSSDYKIIGTYYGDYEVKSTDQAAYMRLDIRDKEGYRCLFKDFKPDIVIHTVSVGSPDYVERNKDIAHDIDVGGTSNIISLCHEYGIRFLYISSNAVYDGNHAPYGEDDEAKPVNYYGKLKLEGELIAKKSHITHAIIRPILIYGWNHPFERANMVTLAIQKLRRKEIVYVYEDVYCNPVLAEFCAKAIWKVIEKGLQGAFNIGGKDRVNIYQFIKLAAAVFELDQDLVKPVRQGFFKELTLRPKDTSYKTDKMESSLGIKALSLRDGLAIMKEKEI